MPHIQGRIIHISFAFYRTAIQEPLFFVTDSQKDAFPVTIILTSSSLESIVIFSTYPYNLNFLPSPLKILKSRIYVAHYLRRTLKVTNCISPKDLIFMERLRTNGGAATSHAWTVWLPSGLHQIPGSFYSSLVNKTVVCFYMRISDSFYKLSNMFWRQVDMCRLKQSFYCCFQTLRKTKNWWDDNKSLQMCAI